ncbi:MAG: homogentisate 1,2-dioxygenase [Pseudomonadota bacterium]
MKVEERLIRGGRMETCDGDYGYLSGFGNTHSTEAVAGALPIGRNSPQNPPLGLYAEQISGTAFTAPRAANRRSWLYRIRPSVRHGVGFEHSALPFWRTAPNHEENDLPAMQLRWPPIAIPETPTDFLDGVRTMTTCGDAAAQAGIAAHVYVANKSMEQRYFLNGDGELALLPQEGSIRLLTEFGILTAEPGDVAVIPRGVKFKLDLVDGPVRGYMLENYGGVLTLPERGPLGSNSLAAERDFLYPAAAYEDSDAPCELHFKSLGKFYKALIGHSPLDVVAWHGDYAPYKYDLRRFATVGSISFDHPDPSIFTVLTSQSDTPGVANVDFVIFPERWLVMEDTFRPPWYHMNIMSEFMGLLYGVYDAKPGGFKPGAMSLHNAMLPHGPDTEAFEQASAKDLAPEKLGGTLAFMFETRFIQNPTAFAADRSKIDLDYEKCWADLPRRFKAPQ